MKTKKNIQNLSEKFANSMLNNFQLNKVCGGASEIPPVIIPTTPAPGPRK